MGSENVSEFRRRRKANLIKVMGNKCNLCGYCKTNSALEFHHLNPEEKDFGIASKGTCHNLQADLNEIKKCILVCANCHREIHDDLYNVEELKQKQHFNNEVANELQQALEKKQYYCKACGKEITKYSSTGFCVECFNKNNRKNRPGREELKQLIRTMPFTQIGYQFGITDNAIRKWCKAENLPIKKTEINQYSDEEWSKI